MTGYPYTNLMSKTHATLAVLIFAVITSTTCRHKPSLTPYVGRLDELLPKIVGEFTLRRIDNIGSEPGSDKVEFGATDGVKAFYSRGNDPSAAVLKIFNFTSVEKPVEILQKQIGIFNEQNLKFEVQDKKTRNGGITRRLVTRGGSMWTNGSLYVVLLLDSKGADQAAFEGALPF